MASQVIPDSATIDTSRYEFVQGQLIERAVPGLTHSYLQERTTQLIRAQVNDSGRLVGLELSLDRGNVGKAEWLTPDVLVSQPGGFQSNPRNDHALPPAFLAVEVLSPGQTFVNMRWKADQYIAWGVEHVWFIDPESKSVLAFSAAEPDRGQLIARGIVSAGSELSLPLTEIFA